MIDIDGGLVRISARYDPALIDRIKRLPGRRFIRERAEWIVPATRAALRQVCQFAEELGDAARLSERAAKRLRRVRPPQIVSARKGGFKLLFSYRADLLERARALPERRYDPSSRTWTVPATRAGALALIALLEEGQFSASPRVHDRLKRLASVESLSARNDGPARDSYRASRSSPIPHWRHVRRGPVFERNPDRHEWVEGVGWCVRIRVDPARYRRTTQADAMAKSK